MFCIGVGTSVGVDFDNTIINYDAVMRSVAVERGLLRPDGPIDKRAIRDYIRERLGGDGDIDWQRVQGEVYGPRIGEAVLIEGVSSFFRRCQVAGAFINIVSHKTELAGYDPSRTNLRAAAMEWMRNNGVFSPGGLGLCPDAVRFAATREEKIDCIRSLGCQIFIDDLAEVFTEPSFPCDVVRILFDPAGAEGQGPYLKFSHWAQIEAYLFDDDC